MGEADEGVFVRGSRHCELRIEVDERMGETRDCISTESRNHESRAHSMEPRSWILTSVPTELVDGYATHTKSGPI
jgi:hypothetical protein